MIDGELTQDELKAIETHLAGCASCAATLEDMRKAVGHLQALEQVEPPPWMTQKVMARVRSLDTVPGKKGFLSWLFHPSGLKIPLGAVASVVLAVTAYFIFEGIIKDMPVRKTVQVSETEKQTAEESRQIPSQPYAPAPAPDRMRENRQSAEKAPAPKTAPPQDRPIVTDSAKDTGENRLWKEEETFRAKPEAPPASMSKPEYRTAPSVAPVPSPARETEQKDIGELRKSKQAGASGMSAQRQYDKAESMPEEYAPMKAKKAARASAIRKSSVFFHVEADDPAEAAARTITIMKEFKGMNIRKEIVGDKSLVKGEINAVSLNRFFDRLKQTGNVREKKAPALFHNNDVLITVEIISGQ